MKDGTAVSFPYLSAKYLIRWLPACLYRAEGRTQLPTSPAPIVRIEVLIHNGISESIAYLRPSSRVIITFWPVNRINSYHVAAPGPPYQHYLTQELISEWSDKNTQAHSIVRTPTPFDSCPGSVFNSTKYQLAAH